VENVNGHPTADGTVSSLGTPVAPVILSAGTVSVAILGGDLLSIVSLRDGDVELLADPENLPPGYRVHGRAAGITLLHPWANRLSADSYTFGGRTGRLEAGGDRVSRDAHGLAIHGLTAPSASPWRPAAEGPDRATAALTWLGEPGFPFPHQITVRFQLSAARPASAALAITTTVCALGDGAVPVAFGWHPYFRRDPAAALQLPALTFLEGDGRGLPTGVETPRAPRRLELADPSHGLAEPSFDDGVSGLSRGTQMRLDNETRSIAVEFGAGYGFGQLFAPPDAPIVSFEPMTAPTDALCRGSGLGVAEPDRPYRASLVVRVARAPRPPGTPR
jgi:aldose 1-epimerase